MIEFFAYFCKTAESFEMMICNECFSIYFEAFGLNLICEEFFSIMD